MPEIAPEDHRVYVESKVKDPTVSVVVPVYNMESKGYLDDLLESLASQSLERIEFLLVDDASTDESLKRMLEFAEGRSDTSVISMRRNSRQGAARNRGIVHARGRYVGFVDGDDVVEPDYYRFLYERAAETGSDIVVASFVHVDDHLGNRGRPILPLRGFRMGTIGDALRKQLIGNPFHVVSAIYRGGLFGKESTLFPEGVQFEDNPATFRVMMSARSIDVVDRVEGALYLYRQSSTSTDHRRDNLEETVAYRISTSQMLIDDAKSSGYYEAYRDEIDLYFIRLAALNTLGKAKRFGDISKSTARFIADVTKKSIHPLNRNGSFSNLSMTKRAQVILCLYFPDLYMAIRIADGKRNNQHD